MLIGHAAKLPGSGSARRSPLPRQEAVVLEILTVCTGNICRSPLAAQLLTTRLEGLGVVVSSAGTRARDGDAMTPESTQLSLDRGVSPTLVGAHRARYLTPAHLSTPDLVLAMARDHRREVVELDPVRARSTFTIREFARLAADVSDGELRAAAGGSEASDSHARFVALLSAIAGRRGLVLPPASPEDDDVIDPIGRSTATYERSAEEMASGVDAVVRVVRVALDA